MANDRRCITHNVGEERKKEHLDFGGGIKML